MHIRSWYSLFCSFVILTVAFGFTLFCWPALYRPLATSHGWSFGDVNAGGAIVLLLIGLLSPAIGILIDRLRPKRIILGGVAACAAAFALLSTIHSLAAYYWCCALMGLGAAAVSILPASMLIGPLFPNGRGLAIGFINAGAGLGGFLAPRLATAEMAQAGIPAAFRMFALTMLVPFFVTVFAHDHSFAQSARHREWSAPAKKDLIRMPVFWISGLALFFCAHGMLAVQQNLISYLTGAGVAPASAALLLAIALGAASPGKIVAGAIADRLGASVATFLSGVFVAAGILALLNTPVRSPLMNVVAVVFGLGYGGVFNAPPAMVFENFGVRGVGGVFGLFYIFFGLGTASGGEFAGHLFDMTHRWSVPFAVDFGFACLGLAMLGTAMIRQELIPQKETAIV